MKISPVGAEFMKISPVGAEFFHTVRGTVGRTDEKTDMTNMWK